MSDLGRSDWDILAAHRTEETEDGRDLNVPTLTPRDDASVLQIYAGNAFNAVIMPVWDSIKPDKIPSYPGWGESLYNIFIRSWYNIICIIVPLALAWIAKFEVFDWGELVNFVLCFIAMIPLQKTLDWGAEQMGFFLGKELSDLLVITLSNAIEVALAVILLFKCELRLLQSTIVGVVLLHLLLIPGVSFFVQGTQVYEQKLSPQFNLNHSLLMTGLLGILVPTIFFAALDRGSVAVGSGDQSGLPANFVPLVSDSVRWDILRMSRGISIMLILIYVTSCLYRNQVLPAHHGAHTLPLHEGDIISSVIIQSPPHSRRPSSERNPRETRRFATLSPQPSPVLHDHTLPHVDSRTHTLRSMTSPAPPLTSNEHEECRVDVNPWICLILLVIVVGFTGATAEFLVSSIEIVLHTTHLPDEWFGLILLPNISFSADGFVICMNFAFALIRHLYCKIRKPKPRKSRKGRDPHRKLKHQHHPIHDHGASAEPERLSPTPIKDHQFLHMSLVDEPEAMEPASPHQQPAKNNADSGARHKRGTSSATALAHHVPAVTVRSPTASSPSGTSSRSAGRDDQFTKDEAEDLKVEDVEAARPVAAEDEDGEDDSGGPWSILNIVPEMPWASEFAHGRPIDLSIQFTLWWMPFLVLLGWWTDRPMHLLFDYFEIGMLLGACFLVNWVTSDAKTNMSEGLTMITFYAMIATAAWWYPGQPQVSFMLTCPGSVAEAVAAAAAGNTTSL